MEFDVNYLRMKISGRGFFLGDYINLKYIWLEYIFSGRLKNLKDNSIIWNKKSTLIIY